MHDSTYRKYFLAVVSHLRTSADLAAMLDLSLKMESFNSFRDTTNQKTKSNSRIYTNLHFCHEISFLPLLDTTKDLKDYKVDHARENAWKSVQTVPQRRIAT